MIKLTRLDHQQFILNADLIRYVENRPDTYVTLSSGERIVVRETMDEVVDRAVEYQQRKAMLPSFYPPAAETGTAAATGGS
ncbi:MAG: flagellar FlbD family protein [Aureliella sp.]